MQSLNHAVASGKVLYLGISDSPAWVVSKANQYARDHGLTQFSVYQGQWSAASRDFEREIIPMTKAEGMSLMPWGALGGGAFKTSAQRKDTSGRKLGDLSKEVLAVSGVLEEIAREKGTEITSVAIAYVMQKAAYVFPIVGGRTVEHLRLNIEALGVELSSEEVKRIEAAAHFELGFPHGMIGENAKSWLNDIGGHFKYVEDVKVRLFFWVRKY